MKILKMYGIFSLLITCSLTACIGNAKECEIFNGAWFDVCVPSNYFLDDKKLCDSPEDKCDSARFYSSSRDSYLYIYSPQWSGDINEYKNEISVQPGEKVVLDNTVNKDYFTPDGKKVGENALTEKELLIEKEGLYKRKYHISINKITNSILVVGLMWPDELSKEANDKYLSRFDEFRKSLKQYSD